jgi:RHS repeat-associated protein
LYTGQREMAGLGIYDYGARFYSPKLGRFLSADTIVPSYTNPQHLNRYMYVLGNPLKYDDPTGHNEDCGIGEACQTGHTNPNDPAPKDDDNKDKDKKVVINQLWSANPFLELNGNTYYVGCLSGDAAYGPELCSYQEDFVLSTDSQTEFMQNLVHNLFGGSIANDLLLANINSLVSGAKGTSWNISN